MTLRVSSYMTLIKYTNIASRPALAVPSPVLSLPISPSRSVTIGAPIGDPLHVQCLDGYFMRLLEKPLFHYKEGESVPAPLQR